MRLQEGVELASIPKQENINFLVECGLIELKDRRISATDSGYLVLNSIIPMLV